MRMQFHLTKLHTGLLPDNHHQFFKQFINTRIIELRRDRVYDREFFIFCGP